MVTASEFANLTPDEVIQRWDGLAVKVAQRHYHRVPTYAYDDLKQACLIALWMASLEWDPEDGTDWELYASYVMHNEANEFVMVERRRGLTRIGDKAARIKKEDFEGPKLYNLDYRDEWIKEERIHKDSRPVEELLDYLDRNFEDERVKQVVELMARHNMTQSEIARYIGVSRQRVSQMLAPVKRLLMDVLARERE